jgi:hypothetical protein
MAQTISFGQGGFTLDRTPGSGTEKLEVIERGGKFQLFNSDGSTIVGLGLQGSSGGDRLEISKGDPNTRSARSSGGDNNAVRKLTANLEGGNDRLVIRGGTRASSIDMGDGNDRFVADGKFQRSDFSGGNGRDVARFKGDESGNAVRKSDIDMGEGDDLLVFGGNVKKLNINLGSGNDEVRFRGDVKKTKLNLGESGDQNIVKLSKDSNFSNFRITGADENDVLFIGSSQYEYDGGRNWKNIDDSDDILKF